MKNFILGLGAVALMTACSPKVETGYTVQGNLAGLTGKVYLTVYEGKLPTRIDSTEAVNGAFTFKGTRDLAIYAAVENADAPLVRFFLENAPIVIEGDVNQPNQIAVNGSPTTDQYMAYRAEMDSVTKVLYVDSLARNNQAEDSMMRLVNDYKMNYIQAHPLSVAAAYVLYREVSYYLPYEQLFQAVAGFDPSVQSSVYLKLVSSMAEALKNTAVGQKYTDVSAPNAKGDTVALSSVVGPGKYVLLDFWASWCPPCRAESPVMVAAYEKYAPKGFEIYAVSLDKTKEAWLKGIQDLKLNWIHVSDLQFWTSAAADTYGVRSIPSNVLIGPDGTILARNLMGDQLEATLAGYLK